MARFSGFLTRFSGPFQWTGGAVFVGALAFCGYSFLIVWSKTPVVTWSRPAPFNAAAVAIDAILFTAFAAHHSVFARQPVKRWTASLGPDPPMRTAYVSVASLLLVLVCAAWQPIGGEVYQVH